MIRVNKKKKNGKVERENTGCMTCSLCDKVPSFTHGTADNNESGLAC